MNFNRLSLIIKREYLTTVGKRSFIFLTLLVPVLMILICGVLPVMLSQVKSSDKKNVAIIDLTGVYAPYIENNDEYTFTIAQSDSSTSAYEYAQNNGTDYYAIVMLPTTMDQDFSLTVFSDKSINGSLSRHLENCLEPVLQEEQIASFHIDSLKSIMKQCDVRLDVKSVKWDEAGQEQRSSTKLAQILGMVLALLTYMFVICYGSMIMNGVIEEKTNRIVEVIVSSCKPMELMLGKIIGVALVGLTQLLIWFVLLTVISSILGGVFGASVTSPEVAETMNQMEAAAEASGSKSDLLQMLMSINYFEIGLCFLFYFIGGYLLYAALFAAFGSAVDQPSDASQFTMPIILIMVFALYAGMFSIENPDGPLAWWCSMIPFTSPIVMMIRLPFDVPVWEMLLSIGLLYGFAFATMYLAGRIYRTGILMYGKKFTVKEILKWVKRN